MLPPRPCGGYDPRVLLLEIAAQGVKGAVPASGRAALRPGYNVVAADGAALRRLLEALLYLAPADAEALARGAGSAPVRAGLTLAGNDGVTYRLVRDFRGAASLQRYDASTRAFSTVGSDPAAIAAHLAGPVGVPGRGRLAALLSLAAAELPSRRAGAAGTLAGGLPVGGAQAPAARRADPAKARARLEALRAELARAGEAEKLQYRLDGLQTRLFRSEEALKEGARVRESAEAGEAALAEYTRIAEAEAALGDPGSRLAAWDRANAKRDEALGKAAQERSALGDDAVPPPAAWRVPQIAAGVVAGVAAIAFAFVGARSSPGLRYLGLLDVPAFGVAAWGALGWIRRLEESERGARRLKLIGEFERKATEQHERDVVVVTAALATAGVPTVAELRERLGKLSEVRAAAEAARARLAAWEASPEVRDAREARGKLEEEIRDAEASLAGAAGGFVRDARTIELEIERAEADLAAAAEPGASEPEAPPEPAPAPTPVPAQRTVAVRAGEPIRSLLAGAAAELGGESALRLRDLAQRAGQLAGALTSNRLGLALEGASVRVVSGGRASSEEQAPPGDRDLAFLAARLAVLERGLAGGGTVALADDAFAGLPEGVRRLAARLLRQLARGGQIVHATSDPAFREAADHVAA
jgi:hypothetical protein